MIRWATAVLLAVLVSIILVPTAAWAHGDVRVVEETIELAPGGSVGFDAALHYHRVVGRVTGDGPVRVRLVAARSGREVLAVGPGTQLAVNELVRCCDEAWAPHTLKVENVSDQPVTVAAHVRLVHDDLAVMVDGAESGTRASVVLLGLGWCALMWHAARRRSTGVPLRRPVIGLALLSAFILGPGIYAALRYGVGGPAAVVAGNAELPVIPLNGVVSRASLLLGVAMIGWATVGVWWVRARGTAPRGPWVVLGLALAGAAALVAIAILVAYGGPAVQTGWLLATTTPIVLVLVSQPVSPRRSARRGPTSPRG